MTAPTNSSDPHGLALDVGERRIGIASARLDVRHAGPLGTLHDPETFIADVLAQCRMHSAAWLVIGLPRGLDGQDTAQTQAVRAFGDKLTHELERSGLTIPVYWIDEALTSHKAKEELQNRRRPYAKGAVDALAATYILEDFLVSHDMKEGADND